MIIKGGSRAAPSQLARHLQRRDTNEQVDILELQSPASDLAEAFRDWQTLVEGTRGFKGLYHANIDPAKDYTMTPEQWQRAVEVLEKELGLEGQPRAVVMHKKHDREHIHVVWARTDIDEMVLRSDSQNYQAHERASQKLENEFGHEHVPGKHAKRDREKQPEFPRAEANHAEWQQGERTGVHPADRRDEITALKQAADNAQAFKAALEDHGYVLAQGDRRDFVVIDQAGQVHSLGRQIEGVKAAELREFMKEIDRKTLPTVEQVREARKEALKPVEPRPEEPAPKPPDTAPDTTSDPVQAQRDAQRDAETEALRKAVADRHKEETRRLYESHREQLAQLRQSLDADTREKLDRLDRLHREQAEARLQRRRQEQAQPGIAGVINSIQDFFSPARAAEREAELQREQAQVAEQHKQERDAYAESLQQTRALEIDNVTERFSEQLRNRATKNEEDLERYLREHEEARQLRAEVEEQERQRELERARDGPDRPPPRAR